MSIEKFAIWARKELIKGVSHRAYSFGFTPNNNLIIKHKTVAHNELAKTELIQKKILLEEIENYLK